MKQGLKWNVIRCVWEHNGDDTLLYAVDFPGAFTRGASLEEAIAKMPREICAYRMWSEQIVEGEYEILEDDTVEIRMIQDKPCDLQVRDADSDVIFDEEREPLTQIQYEKLKALVLKSARDFHRLYASVPDKHASVLSVRKTFYGTVPLTAQEMYDHTKSVNEYYFGEIGVSADNEGTIYECRQRGFEALEKMAGFLDDSYDYVRNPVIEGSYGELWSLRKVLRRFLWHDRIHAKAMYRMAKRTFGPDDVQDVFGFEH